MHTGDRFVLVALAAVCLISGCTTGGDSAPAQQQADHASIAVATEASSLEIFAAREIRRYVYLRTGQLLPIRTEAAGGPCIVLARKDRRAAAGLGKHLEPEQYLLRTQDTMLYVVGGDDVGALYGAYRLAEHFGVWFDLDCDVLPDQQVKFSLPKLDETGKPLFALRGILPFHDFPEGPDWWDTDHYKAIIGQLPKLRMNFFGLHTYPEGGAGPEPTVWIGLIRDVAPGGGTIFNYPASWQNTLRGNWGYSGKKTSDFSFGASQLFEHDAYGCEVMIGHCPAPSSPEACKEVFDGAAQLLRSSFEQAHYLGVKTCLGTETPLIVPRLVRQRMASAGISDTQSLYEGVFQRIMGSYPIDYYWLWTPENWTWEEVSEQDVQKTIEDLKAAIAAANAVNAPFALATCGWVLGPQNDRALFDKVLPKDVSLSCINRQVGKDPVEPGFAQVRGRGKWAIPWLEDDPNLLMPQLWVGRMRKDAADALRYGCDGLMGIHWRTRIIGPNAAALAQAAWDQSGWNVAPAQLQTPRTEGAVGGQHAAFSQPIADTEDPVVYQTVRWNVDAYHLAVPDGKYELILQFCEPHYREPGKRVFGVKVQGKQVIEGLDIFARVGGNRALDYRFADMQVSGGFLDIEFTRQIEFPCIAGIVLTGPVTRKINCGGPAHRDYVADWPASVPGPRPDRFLPSLDFYRRWASAQFGPDAADSIAAIFARIDGHLPEPSTWIDGPGGIAPAQAPWQQANRLYAFVDELAALRWRIRGAGNLQRFDYWLNSFRYMKATERVKFLWQQLNDELKVLAGTQDLKARAALAEKTAVPLRQQLLQAVREVYDLLLATIHTTGELGTVANWEQHVLPGLIDKAGAELAKALGRNLPPDAMPDRAYRGPARVIVPTVQTSIRSGQALGLKAIVLSSSPVRNVTLHWRPMGQGQYVSQPFRHVARGVYRTELSLRSSLEAIEYYVQAETDDASNPVFPATAPHLCQTVVVAP